MESDRSRPDAPLGTGGPLRGVVGLVLVLLMCVGAALWMRRGPRAEAPPVRAGAASATESPAAAAAETATAAGAREASAPAEPERPPEIAPLGPDELLAALLRLARADMQDEAELTAALRPLLVPPANVYAVLERLKAGGLADGAHLAPAELGALRCLVLAVLVFNPAPGTQSTLAAEGVVADGRALVLAILRALPDVLAPTRELLADLVSGQRDETGRAILDASYVPELERLAEAFPEHAELYRRLITAIVDELEPDAAAALRALYVGDLSSPTLVAAGLARWLEENAAGALAWAATAYDDPATSEEVRHAITSSIAKAAPVADASAFLSERAKRTMLVEFLTVGEREGGLDALDADYWGLRVAGDADERARTMLVSGMTEAGPERLLSIAQEDPSASVRAQAWTTLTFASDFRPTEQVLSRMRESWDNRDLAELSVPSYGLISAAGNFANDARGDPELLSGALDLLREIYRDRSQNESDRRRALEKLQKFVSGEEYAQLAREL